MSNMEQRFSIGTVARILGLSTHAIRVWERRYELKLAVRNDAGRREYNQGSIEKLKLIKQALDSGYRISEVAHFSVNELAQLTHNTAMSRTSLSDAPESRVNATDYSNSEQRVLVYGSQLGHLMFQARSKVKYQVINSLAEVMTAVKDKSYQVDGVFIACNELAGDVEELLHAIRLNLMRQQPMIIICEQAVDSATVSRLEKSQITLEAGKVNNIELAKHLATLQAYQDKPKAIENSKQSILSDQQIKNLLGHQSKIYCECPQHLADVYLKIDEFVRYVDNCEKSSPKDAAVHQHMSQKLASLREDFSALVHDVAKMDDIKL